MKLALGALIAVAVLGLWVYAIVMGVLTVECSASPGCTAYSVKDFSAGMVQALTFVGSLVSALVIAELAITKPGEPPMARTLGAGASPAKRKSVQWVAGLYVAVWTCAGLAAYVFGQLRHPNVLQPLTDLGQSWLGLAVAASYTYFGITPAPQTGTPKGVARQEPPATGRAAPHHV